MGHETFGYRIHKGNVVRILWEGRCVMTLGGARGKRLAGKLAEVDEERVQSLLRRVTGNFKRGNERRASPRRKPPPPDSGRAHGASKPEPVARVADTRRAAPADGSSRRNHQDS